MFNRPHLDRSSTLTAPPPYSAPTRSFPAVLSTVPSTSTVSSANTLATPGVTTTRDDPNKPENVEAEHMVSIRALSSQPNVPTGTIANNYNPNAAIRNALGAPKESVAGKKGRSTKSSCCCCCVVFIVISIILSIIVSVIRSGAVNSRQNQSQGYHP
jgi:hypothetical protein